MPSVAVKGPLPVTGLLPRVVAPSLKVTVPVGVPLPGLATLIVAVNVTGWPKTDGLPVVATDVVVLALFTVCPPDSVPLLAAKLELPE